MACKPEVAASKPYELFAAMIDRHFNGIAAYCRPENKVSLGFVEGLNNKISVIQWRAYGCATKNNSGSRFSPACCRNCSISDHLPVIASVLLRRSARRHSAEPERNLTDIAVDMWTNASALPTCPQPQQQ